MEQEYFVNKKELADYFARKFKVSSSAVEYYMRIEKIGRVRLTEEDYILSVTGKRIYKKNSVFFNALEEHFNLFSQ